MTLSVLVATPYLAFGELLHLSLEENGDYQVSQVETGQQVLASIARNSFSLAILDSDLADKPLPGLLQALRALRPDLRLIVIHPENNQTHPLLADFKPDAYLNRRFYVPDLLKTVNNILFSPEENPAAKPAAFPAPLPEMSWKMDAGQAVRQLAGSLAGCPAQAALILCSQRLWASAGSLEQAAINEIAVILAKTCAGVGKGDLARFIQLNSNQKEIIIYTTPLGDDFTVALVFDPATPMTIIRTQALWLANSLKQTNLVILQADMPSPQSPAQGFGVDEWMLASAEPTAAAAPGINSQAQDETLGSNFQPPDSQPINYLSGLDGVLPCYSRLVYVCLMVPRIPTHHLTGELADHLSQWFSQCCLAFGWRLESIAIQSETVQWTIELSPTASPAAMIRILRQRTSHSIFNQYMHLQSENPSGDFWAPGYLILSGLTPPDQQMTRQFVIECRRRQGWLRRP